MRADRATAGANAPDPARHGADIPRSTLIDWCGQAIAVLRPLIERIKTNVMCTDRLHADDTPIQVLDPMLRQTRGKARAIKEGRIWVYVRDDRPWGGKDPPGIAYYFSPDRKGEHPQGHLAEFKGVLQADAYGGFAKLYQATAPDTEPRVREAACWAHLRRDFHDIWKATASPVAKDALERIGRLYDVEREITGQPAERRREARQNRRPHVDAFRLWCEGQLARVPAKGDLAKAMRYALKRWDAFTLFLEDGRIAIDNNPAERAIRPVAIGRKNWLFAGSDAGGETLADAMTIIETRSCRASTPKPTSPTFSRGSTTTSLPASTNCSPGTGRQPRSKPLRLRERPRPAGHPARLGIRLAPVVEGRSW